MMGCSGHEGKKPRKWLLHPQGQHAFGIRSTSRERGSYVSTCEINRFITALGYQTPRLTCGLPDYRFHAKRMVTGT